MILLSWTDFYFLGFMQVSIVSQVFQIKTSRYAFSLYIHFHISIDIMSDYLLNLENVPGRIISGMDSGTSDWVSKESNERNLLEISDNFLDYLNSCDVHDIPEDIEKELRVIEAACIPKTRRTISCHVMLWYHTVFCT